MPSKTTDMATAADWVTYFGKADILTKALTDARSAKAKTIKVGQYLSPNVNRTVPIQVKGRSGYATLRAKKGAANSTLYFFEVVWDSPKIAEDTPVDPIVVKHPTAPQASEVNNAPATEPVAVRNPAGKGSNPGNDEMWD